MESSHRTGNDWINNNNKDVCHNITLVVLYCFVDTYDCLWLWLFNVPVEKPVKSRLYLVYSFETLDCEKKTWMLFTSLRFVNFGCSTTIYQRVSTQILLTILFIFSLFLNTFVRSQWIYENSLGLYIYFRQMLSFTG